MRTTFKQSGERVGFCYTLRQPHCVKIQVILQTKIRRSQYHWNQESPNSSIILSLHQTPDSPNTGSNSYKNDVCEVKESRDNEKKKNCSQQCQEGKKEKLTSITLESKLGKLGAGILFNVILSSQKATVYICGMGFPHWRVFVFQCTSIRKLQTKKSVWSLSHINMQWIFPQLF